MSPSQNVQRELTPENGTALSKMGFNLTAMGNVERFLWLFGDRVRWVEGQGWIAWDEAKGVWDLEDGAQTLRGMVWKTVRFIQAEAASCSNEAHAKAIRKHGYSSELPQGDKGILDTLKFKPGLSTSINAFDTAEELRWLLPCQDGLLNLRTGELGPHRPELFYSKAAPLSFDPSAQCPAFDRYLKQCHADPEVRRFLLQLCGYYLTGVIRDHVLPVWWGRGRNGKGTMDRVVKSILGPYAMTLRRELLFKKTREGHPTIFMSLKGMRYASLPETKEGEEVDVAAVCQLTGGDAIRGHRMGKDEQEFTPTAKLVILTMPKPRITETTDGIWERIQLIPWLRNFKAEGTMDTLLGEKLQEELPGILNRFVAGCLDWQENGLLVPGSVKVETREYRQESDSLGLFLDATVVEDEDGEVQSAPLFKMWVKWCEENDCKDVGTVVSFASRLKLRRFVNEKRGGVVRWKGMRLASDHRGPGLPVKAWKSFEEFMRFATEPAPECWEGLGYLHTLWEKYATYYVEPRAKPGKVEDVSVVLTSLGFKFMVDPDDGEICVEGVNFVDAEVFRARFYNAYQRKPWSDSIGEPEEDEDVEPVNLDEPEYFNADGMSEAEVTMLESV